MPISTRLCLELLKAGSLPLSRFSAGALGALRTPRAAGLLREDRQGAGKVLNVLNPGGFQAWLVTEFPGILGGATGEGPRAANLALTRDSKRGARGVGCYAVLVRAHRVPGQLSPGARDAMAALVDSTRRWGGAALLLDLDPGGGPAAGPCLPEGVRVMTIENQTTFRRSEELEAHADVFLQPGSGGRMRKAFIQWLALQPTLRIIHYGDFDPVGLQEFTLLLAAMPGRVELFVPADIADRIKVFHNRGLLEHAASRAILAGLGRGLHPELDRILDLVAVHGPLEQEAFLVRTANPPNLR